MAGQIKSNMKTLIIHHDADFDGLLSNEICRWFLQPHHEITSVGWDYGKPIPSIVAPDGRPYEQIFMVDISIDQLMSVGAITPGTPILSVPNLIWIDHHKTAIQKYPPTLAGYRIDGVAACRLCWQWFTNKDTAGLPTLDDYVNRQVFEPELLTLAGEHDIWDHRDDRTLPLQEGLRQLEPFEYDDLIEAQFTPTEAATELLEHVVHIGKRALKARQRSMASIMKKRAHDIQWHGYRWLCCNGVSGSQAFESAVLPHHQGLMAWTYDGQIKKVSVSMYHSPGHTHLDFSTIAKEMGGGGHAGACGFTIDLELFIDLLEPFV